MSINENVSARTRHIELQMRIVSHKRMVMTHFNRDRYNVESNGQSKTLVLLDFQ